MEETNFQLHSESINEIAAALSKAQSEIKPAIKKTENSFFKKNYADMEAIDHVSRAALCKNGLSISQPIVPISGIPHVVTLLMHASGQWIKSFYPITYEKTTPQAIGSGVAYARRYSYSAIINVVTLDDDGEAATDHNVKETETKKEQVILKGTYYPEKRRKQTDPAKQAYVDKLMSAKDLIELQSLTAEVKPEWNTDGFKAFVKTLEHKLRAGFEDEMKEIFQAEEIKPEAGKMKGLKG
jgi:hypothetical protein